MAQLLVLALAGSISTVQANGVLREVNGIVGGTTLLSVLVPHTHHMKEVRWKYGSEKVRLGDSEGKVFKRYNFSLANYSQLIKRLDMYNETTLRIRSLTKGDSGRYKADVQFSDGTSTEGEFKLNAYEPIPDLHIKHTFVCTSQGCNLTLDCLIRHRKDLNYTWFTMDPNNSKPDTYLFAGSMLILSLNSNPSDSKYLCVVTTPVELKNISIRYPEGMQQNNRKRAYLAIPIVFAVIVATAFFCRWKNSRQRNRKVPPDDNPDVEAVDAVQLNGTSGALNGPNQAQKVSEKSGETSQEEKQMCLADN